ncbi:unnamed protein product [Polarella glacialis]|uniref:Phorbol-ester/DAG-type domain-containing protein n=1 Tax=Polarella glacialis TaxID=89957 RepID=A0A813D4U7_POLGL|nr:unnamed protein product [Polarella glacialis]
MDIALPVHPGLNAALQANVQGLPPWLKASVYILQKLMYAYLQAPDSPTAVAPEREIDIQIHETQLASELKLEIWQFALLQMIFMMFALLGFGIGAQYTVRVSGRAALRLSTRIRTSTTSLFTSTSLPPKAKCKACKTELTDQETDSGTACVLCGARCHQQCLHDCAVCPDVHACAVCLVQRMNGHFREVPVLHDGKREEPEEPQTQVSQAKTATEDPTFCFSTPEHRPTRSSSESSQVSLEPEQQLHLQPMPDVSNKPPGDKPRRERMQSVSQEP